MKHWFVFFLALASVGTVKGQQTITLSNGNMVAGAYKQPPTRTVQSVDDGYIVTYTFDKATIIDDPLYKGSIMWKVAGFGEEDTPRKPALPYRLDSFTAPDGYSVNVKVVDSLYVELPYTSPSVTATISNLDRGMHLVSLLVNGKLADSYRLIKE